MIVLVERILEAVLFFIAARTGVRFLSAPDETWLAMSRRLTQRRLPVAAIAITVALTAGCLLELAWPGALDALRSDSSGAWWRVLTAPFVQEGVAGAVFNVVSAAIIIALTEWQWGRLVAVAIWLTGAWAPIGDVAGVVGYHISAADTTAYSAGSSGATYFTAAALCAAMIWGGTGRTRLLGLAGPAVALVMWIATNDGHGVVFTEGFVLGLLLWPALRGLGIPAPIEPTALERDAVGTPACLLFAATRPDGRCEPDRLYAVRTAA
jgi:membrane associated rhomboid family serine protease